MLARTMLNSEPHISQGGRRKYGGLRGYGHVPNPVGQRVRSFVHHPAANLAASDLPDAVDNSAACPAVMDQGYTSSCTGHACAGAIYATLNLKGAPLDWVPSPDQIYKVGRCMERVDRVTAFATLSDSGAIPVEVAHGVESYGVCAMGPSADGRNSDCSVSHVNDEPLFAKLLAARKCLVPGMHEMFSVGRALVEDICRALYAGLAVCVDTAVDTALENYAGGVYGAPNPNDVLGRHFLYIHSYRTVVNDNGVQARIFRLRNSWGAGFGLDGDMEVSEAFVAALFGVFLMDVSIREAA